MAIGLREEEEEVEENQDELVFDILVRDIVAMIAVGQPELVLCQTAEHTGDWVSTLNADHRSLGSRRGEIKKGVHSLRGVMSARIEPEWLVWACAIWNLRLFD